MNTSKFVCRNGADRKRVEIFICCALASTSSFYGSLCGSTVRRTLRNLSAFDLRQCDARSIEVTWLECWSKSILVVLLLELWNVRFAAWNRLEVMPKVGSIVLLSITFMNWNRRKQWNNLLVTRRWLHHENYLHHVHGLPHHRIDQTVWRPCVSMNTPCSPYLSPDFLSFVPSLMLMLIL